MDIKELQETDLWALYQKHIDFMHLKHIYSDTDLNYRMYNGDQWHGLKLKDAEKIQLNFIKQVVKQKVSTITSNLFAINYSPENIENPEFYDLAQKSCDLLNKKASKVWDKDYMDKKIKKSAKQSAINDEAIIYVTYDYDNNIPLNEILSKNDVMYGNENEDEIQLQPYILIRHRMTVIEIENIIEKEGLSKELLKQIVTDKEVSTASGENAKDEVEDKVWVITKLYKKNGTIHFSQSTKFLELKKDRDTGLTLYPISHFNWEDQEGSARGVGEVRNLIPNQLEVNKIAMRRALTSKNISYPQRVVNRDAIEDKSSVNKIGSTVWFKDLGNTRASDIFMTTTPGQIGPDSEKLQNELITLSRDLNNAGDATTGNIDPESASGRAILAVQNAQNQPLTDQTISLKFFIEDLARIWFDMWKTYAKDGLLIEVENTDAITGETNIELQQIPNYILEVLNASVKVDITPKGAYDKYAQELSLENMFTQGKITLEEYVESLDPDSVMPKSKLEKIIRKRQEAQKQISMIEEQTQQMKNQAQMQMFNRGEIENIANQNNQMIAQAMQNS